MYTFSEVSVPLLVEISKNLREADVEECLAMGYEDPYVAVRTSALQGALSFIIYYNDNPVGVWGLTPDDDKGCSVWLVGTPELTANPVAFYRTACRFRDALLSEYEHLYNHIHVKNRLHLEFLARLGADFYETGHPDFLEFEITK